MPQKEESNKDFDKTEEEKDNSGSEKFLPEEILQALPEEDRGKVERVIQKTLISSVMRQKNPLAEKITSEHITQLIAKSDEQDKRDRIERKGERNYNLLLIIIALVFIGFLIVFLQGNEDILIKIVIGIISFIGGFGFGQSRKK